MNGDLIFLLPISILAAIGAIVGIALKASLRRERERDGQQLPLPKIRAAR